MKIKSIASICKQRKVAQIFEWGQDSNIAQIIGDGSAFYLVRGIPQLDNLSLLTIFDIPEDKRVDWQVFKKSLADAINLSDIDENEVAVTPELISLIYGDKTLIPFVVDTEVMFFNKKYFEPLEKDLLEYSFSIRYTSSRRPYLCVKDGLWLTAIICPLSTNDSSLAMSLSQISSAYSSYIKRKQRMGVEDGI